jgi:hypothetical protein
MRTPDTLETCYPSRCVNFPLPHTAAAKRDGLACRTLLHIIATVAVPHPRMLFPEVVTQIPCQCALTGQTARAAASSLLVAATRHRAHRITGFHLAGKTENLITDITERADSGHSAARRSGFSREHGVIAAKAAPAKSPP